MSVFILSHTCPSRQAVLVYPILSDHLEFFCLQFEIGYSVWEVCPDGVLIHIIRIVVLCPDWAFYRSLVHSLLHLAVRPHLVSESQVQSDQVFPRHHVYHSRPLLSMLLLQRQGCLLMS